MGKRKQKIGFIDAEIRDELNIPMFKVKGKSLANGIKEIDQFLEQKLGVKGFSAYDFDGYPKKKKRKEEEFNGL